MTHEAIRKRFFVCCRHFGLIQYKNAESRSLNLTAVPHLNLSSLEDIKLSKAWQVEETEKVQEMTNPEKSQTSPEKKVPVMRILNNSSLDVATKIVKIMKRPLPKPVVKHVEKLNEGFEDQVLPASEPPPKMLKVIYESSINFPNSKQIKVEHENKEKLLLTPPETINKSAEKLASPKKSQTKKSPRKSKNSPKKPEKFQENSQNKLLALFEVTPEQYEKLSKSLTEAERTEQISSLMTFLDRDDPQSSADNGNYFAYQTKFYFFSFTFAFAFIQHDFRNFCEDRRRSSFVCRLVLVTRSLSV